MFGWRVLEKGGGSSGKNERGKGKGSKNTPPNLIEGFGFLHKTIFLTGETQNNTQEEDFGSLRQILQFLFIFL